MALDFTGKLDESTIKGKAAMARAKVAAYEFDLNIDKTEPRPLSRLVGEETGEEAGEERRSRRSRPKDKEADAPVDLSGTEGR